MNRFSLSNPKKSLLVLTLLGGGALLNGCAFQGGGGSAAGNGGGGGGTLTAGHTGGSVIGGQNPLSGAKIQLYQIAQSADATYVANAQPLLSQTVTTGTAGQFDITGLYNCTPGSYLYITAVGGDPGLSTGVNNNITLAASVGLCDNLPTYGFIAINEVTTTAFAYSFAQFARTSLFGTAMAAQSAGAATPALNVATSSTNLQGIATAAATYNVLVNAHDGTSPGSNGTGNLPNPLQLSGLTNAYANGAIAEFWQINTIADILAACVNSGGYSSTDTTQACNVLFSNVTPYGGVAPADTMQAALDLALYPALPSAQIQNLYNTISATAPFVPYVPSYSAASASPTIYDFSVGYTLKPVIPGTSTELLLNPTWLGMDGNGNIWVTQQSTVSPYPANAFEMTNVGVPIRAGQNTGSALSNYQITTYGMGGGSGSNGTSTTVKGQYIFYSTNSTYNATGKLMGAIDANNNLWFGDRGNFGLVKVPGSGANGTQLAYNGGNYGDVGGNEAVGYQFPAGPATNGWAAPSQTFIDGNNTIWETVEPFGTLGQETGLLGACPTPATLPTLSNATINAGLWGFPNADPSGGFYPGATYVSTTPTTVAMDPNVNDTVTVAGTPTAIPGAPFLWTTTGTALDHQASTTTGGGHPGCATTVNQIGWAATTGVSAGGTTQLPGIANGGNSADLLFPIGQTTTDIGFDGAGYLWIARGNYLDPATSGAQQVPGGIVKILPNYGASTSTTAPVMSGANMAAATNTFSYFYTGTGFSSTNKPQSITVDGDGDVFYYNSSAKGVGELSNSGALLSPIFTTTTDAGFHGSICTGCKFRGETAETYQRITNTYANLKPTIDRSGNLYSFSAGTGLAYIQVIVGLGAPTAQPMSQALATKKVGARP